MKRYLFIALATFALIGCTEDMTDSTPLDGELEQSYIAVTLASDEVSSRANGDAAFEYGDEAERYVESAHFFLFKADGSAFPVNGVSGKNYLSFTLNSNGTQPGETGRPDAGPNVSDVKDKILVFNNYKGEYPSYIVAVLNWDEHHIQPSYTLDNLYNTITNIRNANDHFVMSNAVYADTQGEIVRASRLSVDNIGKTEAEAMAHPVQIYVERLSAKVEVRAKGNVAGQDATYDIAASVGGTPVYAKVLTWELHNEYHQSILLKHIYPHKWGLGSEVGFLWNDPVQSRSYWATSHAGTFPSDNHFDWSTGGLAPDAGVAYVGENTQQPVLDGEGKVVADPRTKVIIKAQLVDASGTPLELALWYGMGYVGETVLRQEVAKLLASQLYYREGGAYRSIDPADLKLVAGTHAPAGAGVQAYEAFFQIADASRSRSWYTYSSADGYTQATIQEVNSRLAQVAPALVYKNGMTYYFTDIRHLGRTDSASAFGIVRNHIYRVNISAITGFGTPVYDADVDVEVPQRPTQVNSYVAAEMRILSWKVVKNGYNIE
ncbi:MAG: Mfa1 fimbrilin C-terminal domain-containing protein [Bacteroidaceae bacterium]|nr:Mfa1 fimbrilin C-terminal domain-containing protein [Bacteroidaceae bacterium]